MTRLPALLFALFLLPAPVLADPHPEALQFVQKFVAEELRGDLNGFLDYDLATLEGHPLYGAPGRTFDTDDCNLVRALFHLLYRDAFPGLTLDTLGTGRPYRGDTLNTFNTLLGRPIPDQPGRFAGLEKFNPSDSLRARAAAFHRTYHMLGNLAPIPNRSLNRQTLNTYRGTHPDWRDAFPVFLVQLQPALLRDPSADPFLSQLVEHNADAFAPYRTPGGVAQIAERLDLHDYIHPATRQPIPHYHPNAHWLPQPRAAYLDSVHHYLDTIPPLIHQRTQRMINRLRPLLLEN